MPKLKSATVCGVTMHADTVTAAKEAATLNATAAIKAVSQSPAIYLVHGLTVIVYPIFGGHTTRYMYDVVDPANPRTKSGYETHGISDDRDRDECIDRAVMHAAQNAWDDDVVSDDDFVTGLPYALGPGRRAELTRWILWQRRAGAARQVFRSSLSISVADSNSKVQSELHRIACEASDCEHARQLARDVVASW